MAKRPERFVGGEEDVSFGPFPPDRGYRVDVDGDGQTTALVRGGRWVEGDSTLVALLEHRRGETGLSNDHSLASDAVHLLELPDDAMTKL